MFKDYELNVAHIKSNYKHAALKEIAVNNYGVIPKAGERKGDLAERIITAAGVKKQQEAQKKKRQEANTITHSLDTLPAETNATQIDALKNQGIIKTPNKRPQYRGNPQELQGFMDKNYPQVKFVINGECWHMHYRTLYNRTFKNKATNEVRVKTYEHAAEDSGNVHIPLEALKKCARTITTLPPGSVVTPY